MRVMRRLGWRVPILMYHRVLAEGAVDPTGYFFSVPQRRLEQQMRWLKALGHHVVSLDDIVHWLEGKRRLPSRPVAITFDDGYEDAYRLAAPVLERYRYPATFFLIADRLGGWNDWDTPAGTEGYRLIGRDEALDLARRGFTLGSHSRTHRELPGLSQKQLRDEVTGSRRSLAQQLGMPVRFFAYPFNITDRRCQNAVRRAGYHGACAGGGRAYHAFCLDRVDVSRAPLPVFLAKVSPWFHAVRRARACLQERPDARLRAAVAWPPVP
ncbi:MAG: polysaccharide deacetylase family protein [Armatimonadetes bacterium]|nr:polysaccharide deacetylase family protein [Armatimonadota bacterium]